MLTQTESVMYTVNYDELVPFISKKTSKYITSLVYQWEYKLQLFSSHDNGSKPFMITSYYIATVLVGAVDFHCITKDFESPFKRVSNKCSLYVN